MENDSLEDVETSFIDAVSKTANGVSNVIGKGAGYCAGFVTRIYKDTKESVSNSSFYQSSFSGVDFKFLTRRRGESTSIQGDEGNTPEFYEGLGREIFHTARAAEKNENLVIINTSKYR
ncbi:hypothetical protein WDW37_15045 [Bdellovibrionota bacterium FG-1]